MNQEVFLKKAGFNQYYMSIANKKEKDRIWGLYWVVNKEIDRVKNECRDFYRKFKFNEVDVNCRVNQELNKLYSDIDYTLRLGGWHIRFDIWYRKFDEENMAMLERTSRMSENLKWKEINKGYL